jgi:hypothetical protein
MQIAAFGAGKSIFQAEGNVENDKCGLDGGEGGIRTRGSVRHRFGFFAAKFALRQSKPTRERNTEKIGPGVMPADSNRRLS